MRIKNIFGPWRCLSKNPALATRILIDVVGATLLKPFNHTYVRYERDLEEAMKGRCPEEQLQGLTIWTVVMMSLAFSMMYLFLYLTYGKAWV
jgi:hypothetical protein